MLCLCVLASEDLTALYSEIMMYVLLVFLTFWLLVEMVYCYRKISKSDEQAQDSAWVSKEDDFFPNVCVWIWTH